MNMQSKGRQACDLRNSVVGLILEIVWSIKPKVERFLWLVWKSFKGYRSWEILKLLVPLFKNKA